MVFVNVLLPVFLIFAVGYVGQKRLKVEIRSVSTAALYLMSPALAFRTFYITEWSQDYLFIFTYSLVLCLILFAVIKAVSRIRGWSSPEESGMMLATVFMNNGNMGVPVVLFAFGKEAVEYAVIIMVVHTFLMSTLGVYIAARGALPGKQAWMPALRMPIAYAAVLGLLWQEAGWPMPRSLYQAVDLVADAAIPVIMLALGMQLAMIRFRKTEPGKVVLALGIRFLLSPCVAWLIAWLLQVDPLLRQVMVVAAAMPSAAVTTMYSLQFDSEPEMVSTITLISTLLSALTLSGLLLLLQ